MQTDAVAQVSAHVVMLYLITITLDATLALITRREKSLKLVGPQALEVKPNPL